MDEPRRKTVTFLALLSSDVALRILSEDSDPERLAFELCRAWFDKIYVPSESYLDGLRGDRSEEAVMRFLEAFDDAEATALERFHRFFELRMTMVPDSFIEEGRIPIRDSWFAITRDAGYLLDALVSDSDAIRQELLHRLSPARSTGVSAGGAVVDLILRGEPRPDRRPQRPEER